MVAVPVSDHIKIAAKTWGAAVVRVLLTAGIFWWLLRRVNITDVWEHLKNANLGLSLAAVALMVIQRVTRCLNWAQLLYGLGVRVPRLRWKLLQVYFAGGFLGAVFPSTATADAIRTLLVKRVFGGHLSGLAATAVLLNAVTWSGACAVGLIGIAILAFGDNLPEPLRVVSVLFVVVSSVLGIVYTLLKAYRRGAMGFLRRVSPSFFWLREIIRRFLKALLLLERESVKITPVIVTAVVAQIFAVASLAMIGSAVGIVAPFGAYLVAAPLQAIVGLVPASVLGFGPMQAFHVFYFRFFGVEESAALVMSTIYTTVAVGIHLVIGATVLACNGVGRRTSGGNRDSDN